MNIRIPRKKIITALWLTSVVLIVLSVSTQIYKSTVLNGTHNFLTVAFNLDREYNFPTFFMTLMLLTCSVLLVVIGESKRDIKGGFRWHWTVLGIIFLYLASDEILMIHERATGPVRDMLHVGGLFYFAWIIPAGIIVLVIFVFYRKFLAAQPAGSERCSSWQG
jgi:hypothetical protein